MAKEKEVKASSWDDFNMENLLNSDEEVEDQETDENEEDHEEEEQPEKKKAGKKKPVAVTEEEEEEEPEPKAKVKKKETPAVETEEETEEEEQTEDADPATFYEEVNKITGHSVEVEYGEVDPSTPQGVALRDKAIREQAVDSLLEEIESMHPTAWKALQHAYAGGDIADLFKTASSRDYSKVTIGEKDTALATEILKEYYNGKGIKSDKRLTAMIEAAEDSEEGLIGEANAVLEELRSEQEAKKNEILEQQKVKDGEQKKRNQVMVAAVDEVLETLNLGTFKISSKQEAAEFRKFVLGNLKITSEGKYEMSTPLDGANLAKQLQYQFFQFKKGDLSNLIQIKAATENAKKLKMNLRAEDSKLKKAQGEVKTMKVRSMNDFNV